MRDSDTIIQGINRMKVQNGPFDWQGSNGSYPEEKSSNIARCVEKYRQTVLVLGSSWRSALPEHYVIYGKLNCCSHSCLVQGCDQWNRPSTVPCIHHISHKNNAIFRLFRFRVCVCACVRAYVLTSQIVCRFR